MKDLLVHIDDSERCAVRLGIALDLARRFDARLTGLFARNESRVVSSVVHQASEALAAARAAAKEHFLAEAEAAGVKARWWQLSHGEPGHVLAETMFCSRFADLVILGQHDPEHSPLPHDLVEHVILHSGRPVLVVPSSGNFATVGERIVVAWNAGREAARALADAQPLLVQARSVTVVSLRGPQEGDASSMFEVPPVDVLDHLAAHGIQAEGERLVGEQIGKMDMLLSRLCDLGADLVVLGAHGQYALSPRRGSGTRFVLAHMTVPVLMSY